MEIGGLPLHVLVVHFTVILIPLTATLAIAFAVLPNWRWLSRWPTALAAVGALGLVWFTRSSGRLFLDAGPDLEKLV